jgi:hypothetical protein
MRKLLLAPAVAALALLASAGTASAAFCPTTGPANSDPGGLIIAPTQLVNGTGPFIGGDLPGVGYGVASGGVNTTTDTLSYNGTLAGTPGDGNLKGSAGPGGVSGEAGGQTPAGSASGSLNEGGSVLSVQATTPVASTGCIGVP